MGVRRSVGAAAVLAAVWAAPAAAQAPGYGGGRLPSAAVPGRGYVPTLGITLQPRGDKMALRFDTSLRCGRTSYDVVGRTACRSTGAASAAARRGGMRHPRAGGSTTPGRSPARPTARSRRARCGSRACAIAGGRRTACNRKPTRRFAARLAAPAPGRRPAAARQRGVRRPQHDPDRRRPARPRDPQGHEQRPPDRRALDRARRVPPRPARRPRELHAVDADRRRRALPPGRALRRPLQRRARPLPRELRRPRLRRGCRRQAADASADLQPVRQPAGHALRHPHAQLDGRPAAPDRAAAPGLHGAAVARDADPTPTRRRSRAIRSPASGR